MLNQEHQSSSWLMPAPVHSACLAAFLLVRLSFLVSLLASFPLHMHPFRWAAGDRRGVGAAKGGCWG